MFPVRVVLPNDDRTSTARSRQARQEQEQRVAAQDIVVNVSNPMLAAQAHVGGNNIKKGKKGQKIKKGVVVHRHKRVDSMIMATVVACRLNNTIAEIIVEAVNKCDLARLTTLQVGAEHQKQQKQQRAAKLFQGLKTGGVAAVAAVAVDTTHTAATTTTAGGDSMTLKDLRAPERWRLKVVGRCDYLMDIQRRLISSMYVQECLRVGKSVVLKLVRAKDAFKATGQADKHVREVFMIHVGGTRCVPSSTGNIMNIQARITLKVEFIRTCIFLFLFYV
jgi:hypothetical protein